MWSNDLTFVAISTEIFIIRGIFWFPWRVVFEENHSLRMHLKLDVIEDFTLKKLVRVFRLPKPDQKLCWLPKAFKESIKN
jgi:hypothetical protein